MKNVKYFPFNHKSYKTFHIFIKGRRDWEKDTKWRVSGLVMFVESKLIN